MALDAFIGKWREEEKENFDAFAAAIGLPQNQTEFYKQTKTVISYNKDGEGWIIDVGVLNGKGKEFSFKLGVPYDSENLDGTPMKSVITELNGKFVETHKMAEMENEMKIERVIQDPATMLVTTEYKGHVMLSRYTRVC